MAFSVCTECSLIQLGLLANNWLSFAVFFLKDSRKWPKWLQCSAANNSN